MKHILLRSVLLAILFLFSFQMVLATDFYCDPVNGRNTNDGSRNSPWGSIESVFKDGKKFSDGDVIFLLTGNHGNVIIVGENKKYIKIIGAKGHDPLIKSIVFGSDIAKAVRWEISYVKISNKSLKELVLIHKNSSRIRLKSNEIYFDKNGNTAVNLQGSNCKLENNFIHHIKKAILISNQKNQIRNNRIENFSGNAIEISENYNLLEYNLIKESNNSDKTNAIYFNSNPVKGNILRGNTIINFVKSNGKEHGILRGIYGKDLNLTETIIENNVIISNAKDGISLSGVINNTKIVNNTVVNPYFGVKAEGLEGVNAKLSINISGKANSNNIIVRNNLVNNLVIENIKGLADHNMVLPVYVHDYDQCFNNWALFDFSLSKNSKALNKGTKEYASKTDIHLNKRLLGNFVNIGAFEYMKINDANETFIIKAELSDRQIHSKGKADWDGQPQIRVGGAGEKFDAAGVFPFKLPLIPGGKEIISANFKVYLEKKDNKPEGGVDVYALQPKTNYWVTEDMFYQGTYGQDLKARPIQRNIADTDSFESLLKLDAKGQAGLEDYLETIYKNGSKAGDYMFLRLNPSSKDVSDFHRWNFASSNSKKEERRPILEITVGYPELNKPGAGKVEELKHIIIAAANPIKNGELSLYFIRFEKTEDVTISLFTYKGKEVLKTNLKPSDLENNIYRTKNLSLSAGKYILKYAVNSEIKKQTLFVW